MVVNVFTDKTVSETTTGLNSTVQANHFGVKCHDGKDTSMTTKYTAAHKTCVMAKKEEFQL